MAKSSQVTSFVILFVIVAICASPVPPDKNNEDVVRRASSHRMKRASEPSRKQTEYEIGILRGYLNNEDLYFCRGDPYKGIQCPEENQCVDWHEICDDKQVCAVKNREMCLNRTRESYGQMDPRLCNGDENEKWCYWKNLAPRRCGEDIFLDPKKKRSSANIKSPGYPRQNYPSDLFCFWTVSVPRGRRLSVRFRRFNTEANYDYLSAGHGSVRDDARNTVVFKHSGSKLPDQSEWNSRTNSIWITFRADDWDGRSGFVIRVQDTQTYNAGVVGQNPFNAEPNKDCGNTYFFEPHDIMTLSSPHYPNFYDNYIECEWIVSTSPGRRMQITFTDFFTEDGEDFLSVGNGIFSRRAPILYKYSGDEPPKKIISRGSDVWFKFATSLAISRRGFHAVIKEKPISECGGSYIVPSEGSLHVTTQFYPSAYPSYSKCIWRFRNMAGRGLFILFSDFYTEPGYDAMSLGTGFEIQRNYTNAIIFRHSGDGLPELSEFLIRDPEAWIKFVSDGLSNKRGFAVEIFDELVAPRSLEEMIVVEALTEEVELPSEGEDEEEADTEQDPVEEAQVQVEQQRIVPEIEEPSIESSYAGSSSSSV